MTTQLLDVSKLPTKQVIACDDDTEIDMEKFLAGHYDDVMALIDRDRIGSSDSFGFAMASPQTSCSTFHESWDDPSKLVWFVGGWGPNRDRYIANAARKLRALARPMRRTCWESTLEIRMSNPDHFQEVVETQNNDGTFSWGDFPYGGAASLRLGNLWLAGACSAFSQVEDQIVTSLILGNLAKKIIVGNKLL